MIKWVYQYSDGNFFCFKGETSTLAIQHTSGLNNASLFDLPNDNVINRYQKGSGTWLQIVEERKIIQENPERWIE